MANIFTTFGAHHLRIYSSVDISTGLPLGMSDTGKPLRKQQKIMLVRIDDGLHNSRKSPAVLRLAADKVDEITRWEEAATSGEPGRPDGNMPVSVFFNTVFMPYTRKNRAASTTKSYELYWAAYLRDHFNHSKTLKDYEAFEGTNFLEKMCDSYSTNTVMHIRALASRIFGYACSKGYISYNPWRDVEKNHAGQSVEATYAYNPQEIERIIAALEHVSGRETYSAQMAGMLISTCFYAGLRPSEAAGLQWENVLDEDRLNIQHAYVAGDFKKTKTKKDRTITMLPQLKHRMRPWAMLHNYPTSGWVFPNQSGDAPMNINDVSSRVIAKTLKAAGLDWYGFYACRRGFGTMMVLAGASAEQTAMAMGNSIEVVMRHYFIDNKESKLAAQGMAKLAAAMAGEQPSDGDRLLLAGGAQ